MIESSQPNFFTLKKLGFEDPGNATHQFGSITLLNRKQPLERKHQRKLTWLILQKF